MVFRFQKAGDVPGRKTNDASGKEDAMVQIEDILGFMENECPKRLAESWDNVGLLLGDTNAEVHRLMTCLTITPATVAEAIDKKADLIISHHPCPFQPIRRITTETTVGRLLWALIGEKISVISPHTSFDSSSAGINQMLAEMLELEDVSPLIPEVSEEPDVPQSNIGAGRIGWLRDSVSILEFVDRVKEKLRLEAIRWVGQEGSTVSRVAVGCGAADQWVHEAHRKACDVLVVGEAKFHACLEAEALGLALVLPGHFSSERFAVERLVERLAHDFEQLEIWACEEESDPIHYR
jgi:dinuclear metal center YbgI/SA1388 family protein